MHVPVTESIRVSIVMKIAPRTDHIEVPSNVSQVQSDSMAFRNALNFPLALRQEVAYPMYLSKRTRKERPAWLANELNCPRALWIC